MVGGFHRTTTTDYYNNPKSGNWIRLQEPEEGRAAPSTDAQTRSFLLWAPPHRRHPRKGNLISFHFSPKKTEIFFVIFLSLSLLSRGAVATPRHPRSSSGRFSPQPTPSGNPKTTTQLFSSRSSGGIRRPRPPILPFRRDRNPPENHRPTGVSITRQVLRRCPTKSRSNNNNNNKND